LIKIFNRPVLDIATPDLKQYPPLPRTRRKKQAMKDESTNAAKATIIPPQSDDELPEDFHE